MSQHFTISEITNADIDDIISIADEELGFGYVSKAEIKECITNPNKYGFVVYDQNQLLGFTVVEVISISELNNLVLKDKRWFNEIFQDHKSIGLRRHTVVKKEYQRKGVGSLLARNSTRELDKNVNCIISIGWENQLLIPIRKALEKNGYSIVKIIRDYWLEDSIARKYICPECGEPPCNCTAHIFVRYN